MHNGLYLGGVQLPFVSSLRVYLPREAYTEKQFGYFQGRLEEDQNAVTVDAQELADSLGRVSRSSANPLPTPAVDRVRVLQMSENSPLLYAPNQVVARSISATAELLSGPMAQLARLVVPEPEWSENLQRAAGAPELDTEVQTRTSTWGIPFSWFTLVFANDRMEVVEANGRVLTVRIQVPVAVAAARAGRTLKMLAEMAPDLDLFEELDDLHSWLQGFSDDGVVELDYGPIANRVHPDDSPADVHAGLACLADGDLAGAAAAYRRLASRWIPIRQLARAN
ncbi:hypothetical protein AL755_01300 (plasmid) [Arthrobacter sp. ERGS1:01]|uniref:hypothetical protein n=1 Tax=Arthrobacter sp. ERGS1:01 TaxID=1704044 RepID=UPI0006B63C49|nr:hypothetical protein [Arthrobacter sp. ERGS1:01]ALE04363.1 hypothetical protein AL755_01300 [Arthrobacter sp. ERGS1:01]